MFPVVNGDVESTFSKRPSYIRHFDKLRNFPQFIGWMRSENSAIIILKSNKLYSNPNGSIIMMASSDKAKNGDATQQKKHLRRLSILLLGQTDVAHRKTTAHALKRVSDQRDFQNRNLVTEEGGKGKISAIVFVVEQYARGLGSYVFNTTRGS